MIAITGSPARQGLAVLMASAVVVLKHETSTVRQVKILYQLISHLAWVKEVISPAKFGSVK